MSQEIAIQSIFSSKTSVGLPASEQSGKPANCAASLRQSILEDLRNRIRRIERSGGSGLAGPTFRPSIDNSPARASCTEGHAATTPRSGKTADPGLTWQLGVPEVDGLLGPEGLEIGGVHEIKPALQEQGTDWAATWATAFIFSLTLAIRRCAMTDGRARRPILCCRPAAMANEFGSLYGPGLRALGLDPERLIIVETKTATDTLWAIEEGLKSRSLALVLGALQEVELTPARRLALAASAYRVPCVLLTHPRTETMAATATRWRVGPLPSAPHPFDPHAPGALRFTVDLERCRARPLSAETASFSLEWCDEALCFRLAPGVADRADAARESGSGAG